MNRRSFLRGSLGFLAAPAIVRVASLMPVRPFTFNTAQSHEITTGTLADYAALHDEFLEGMQQRIGTTLFYGDTERPEWPKFNGFAILPWPT